MLCREREGRGRGGERERGRKWKGRGSKREGGRRGKEKRENNRDRLVPGQL